ncbi:MAG: ribosome silencing factor [Proteobacteria bacterium]|nr:ribosome silencing factor [Pseudomonadota bacterium]
MKPKKLCDSLVAALEEVKGRDIVAFDVRNLTDITDYMIIASGTSGRHVKALADQVIEAGKALKNPPLGVEGRETNEWVLIDLTDVVVHVMQSEARNFYDLERLWQELPMDSETI